MDTFSPDKVKKKKREKEKIPAGKGKAEVLINSINNPETDVCFNFFPLPPPTRSKFK